MLGIAQPALADDFTVNSTADNGDGTCQDVVTGDCTLRDAIYDANAGSGSSYIYFASSVTGTITLNGDELPVTYPTYIYRPGPDVLAVSGDDTSRIFNIDMDTGGDVVAIDGLTLTHGYASGPGGAIYNYDATLALQDDALTANHADGYGGALFDAGESPSGGYDNTLSYSTIEGNTSDVDGGGLYGVASLGTIGTSTITGNHANPVNGIGGGASSNASTFTYSSTITENSSRYAGGIANLEAPGYLYSSIVANNTAPGQDPDLGHDFYAGFDLIKTPDTAGLGPPTIPQRAGANIVGQDPQLGPLQNNGGNTLTERPAAPSPVVDQSLSYDGGDQRFVQRPIDIPARPNAPGGDGGDMGSVELTQAEAAIPSPPPTPPTKKKKCKKKKKKHHRSAESAKKKKCKKKHKKRAASAAGTSASPWRQAADRWARQDHPALRAHHAFRASGY